MTELNAAPETEPAAKQSPGAPAGTPTGTAEARVDWPALPAVTAGAESDAVVETLLERLEALPALPVAAHGEVYAGLHNDLMEALDDAGGSAP